MADTTHHQFLELVPVRIPKEEARQSILKLLPTIGLSDKRRWDWAKDSFMIPMGEDRQVTFRFRDLESETVKTGFPASLLQVIDRRDACFGGRILLATNSTAINITVNHKNYHREHVGPSRSSPLEDDLTQDILYYRAAACASSASDSFYECTRHYRSFLQSSVSLVDFFLNQYAKHLACAPSPPAALPILARGPVEDRLNAWAEVFGATDPAKFRNSAERGCFTQLRKARNKFVHAAEPYVGVDISEIPTNLNGVRRGVGGLLLLMRKMAGLPTLGFIERLRMAPMIKFTPK
jgi:hypothetical protein